MRSKNQGRHAETIEYPPKGKVRKSKGGKICHVVERRDGVSMSNASGLRYVYAMQKAKQGQRKRLHLHSPLDLVYSFRDSSFFSPEGTDFVIEAGDDLLTSVQEAH